MEQTSCSTKLPSGGELTIDDLIPMIQRMLTEMTLGEQEKLRLLLITLFSFPHLSGTQPVSYTHLDVYKRQVAGLSLLKVDWGERLNLCQKNRDKTTRHLLTFWYDLF